MSRTIEIKLPFPGLYGSYLEAALEHEATTEAHYFAEERQAEEGISEPLRLDEQTYADLLYGQTDHQQQHEATAKAYCEVFSDLIDEDFEFDLGLVFNDLTSPREYNFETDRLFARMPKESAQKLFQISAEDEHKTLRKVLKDRHSSYDGFISHYSNCLSDWLRNPVTQWDHNELESLLWACLLIKTGETGDEFADKVTSYMEESSETFYTIFTESVDWTCLEQEVQEARDEIEAELREDDPDLELPYHCPETPDLFTQWHP